MFMPDLRAGGICEYHRTVSSSSSSSSSSRLGGQQPRQPSEQWSDKFWQRRECSKQSEFPIVGAATRLDVRRLELRCTSNDFGSPICAGAIDQYRRYQGLIFSSVVAPINSAAAL